MKEKDEKNKNIHSRALARVCSAPELGSCVCYGACSVYRDRSALSHGHTQVRV